MDHLGTQFSPLSPSGHEAAAEALDQCLSRKRIKRQFFMERATHSALFRATSVVLVMAIVAMPSWAMAGIDGASGGLDGFIGEKAHAMVLSLLDVGRTWLGASFERAPALVLGLGALLAVPPLALLGLALKRRDGGDATRLIRTRPGRDGGARERVETGFSHMHHKDMAFEVADAQGGSRRFAVKGPFTRIGRESDNDICLSDSTVHRYHAAVHQTEDGDLVITDLSSATGNGVTVNGHVVQEARLSRGDVVELGRVKLRFVASGA